MAEVALQRAHLPLGGRWPVAAQTHSPFSGVLATPLHVTLSTFTIARPQGQADVTGGRGGLQHIAPTHSLCSSLFRK